LSYLDCDYGQALLKKKKMKDELETLNHLYEAAKITIIKLTENMIKPAVSLNIFFKHYQEVNRKNVIKLLLRCRRLYDARNQMVSISGYVCAIDAIMQPGNVLWRALQDGSPVKNKTHSDMVNRTLRFLSAALTKISTFQHEHKLFAGEFKFKDRSQVEVTTQIGAILGGYLLKKREAAAALLSNGLLLEEHGDGANLQKAYKEWLKQHGEKMVSPTDEEVNRWLAEENTNESRVDKALKAMPEPVKPLTLNASARVSEDEGEFYRLDSSRFAEEGKTLISDQNIERKLLVKEKRESLLTTMRRQADVSMEIVDSPTKT
jgi:hypothetical protein